MITSCLLGDADYFVKIAEHGHDRRLGSRGLYAQPDGGPLSNSISNCLSGSRDSRKAPSIVGDGRLYKTWHDPGRAVAARAI
jgi:hypothetical protein